MFQQISSLSLLNTFSVRFAEVCKRTRFRWQGRVVTGEGDCYEQVVGHKGGNGGQHRIREEMPAQKGDIWRGELAMGGEESGEILIRNSKLQIAHGGPHLWPLPFHPLF